MTRRSSRPWPRSRDSWATGTCCQGRDASWANRRGWLRLTVNRKSAPGPGRVLSMATLGVQRIGGDDRAGDADASIRTGNIGISFVFAPTSTWPRTAP